MPLAKLEKDHARAGAFRPVAILLVAAFAFGLGLRGLAQPPRRAPVVRGFKQPYMEGNVLKARVRGGTMRAVLGGKDLIFIEDGFVVETFADGDPKKIETVAEAPRCVLDNKTHVVYSDGPITIRAISADTNLNLAYTTNILISGTGFSIEQGFTFLTISNNAKTVVFSKDKPKPGEAVSTNGPLVIHSDFFQYSLKSRHASYRGHVRADEAPYTLEAVAMEAQLGTNNAPATINADGEVVITDLRDQGRATGDRAVYDSANGSVRLTGQPHWQDALGRQAWAREFVFDRKTGIIRGEGEARSLLPGSVLGASDLGLPGDSRRSKDLPGSVFDIHAGVISLSTGAGGEARQIEAHQHVIMTNEVERSWASADDAQFFQAKGLLRLSGSAIWILGEDQVEGSVVELNNLERTLAAHTNAVVQFPARIMEGEGNTSAARPGRATNANSRVVVHSDEFLLRTNAAFFTDRVRAVETDDGEKSAVLNCRYLETGFDENRHIQSLLARGEVRGEEFPVKSRAAAGHLVCERLKMAWYPGGKFLREVEANESVRADQTLFKPVPNPPVYREVRADALWASFSSRTNEVESGWAEKNVFLLQKEIDPSKTGPEALKSARGARGGRADYLTPPGGKGLVLTDHPVAWLEKTNSADMVLNADSLIWNPETGRFQGRGPYRIKPVDPAELPR